MQKSITLLPVLMLVFVLSSGIPSNAETLTLTSLVENARIYDGKTIEIQGEALGEIMERGQNAWVNISDQTSAAGIWLPLVQARKITSFGDYKHKGDTILLTGTFHNACAQHDGELDIHAASLEILEKGHSVEKNVSVQKMLIALLLFLLGGVSLFVLRRALNKTVRA